MLGLKAPNELDAITNFQVRRRGVKTILSKSLALATDGSGLGVNEAIPDGICEAVLKGTSRDEAPLIKAPGPRLSAYTQYLFRAQYPLNLLDVRAHASRNTSYCHASGSSSG